MAFDPKNDKLKETLKHENSGLSNFPKAKTPISEENQEKRKPYTFTLQPSIHKKLKRIAKNNNFTSTSNFLNELIKNLEE